MVINIDVDYDVVTHYITIKQVGECADSDLMLG